jgi:hypothetical protein
MRRTTRFLVAITVLASFAATGSPPFATAQEGTPVAPVAEEFCTDDELDAGSDTIVSAPIEDYGVVLPADAPDHQLYLTVFTLPPDTCLIDRWNFGANVFQILSGTVDMAIAPGLTPEAPVIEAGTSDGTPLDATSGTPLALAAGDWVTIDREADFALRNRGDADAVVVVATFEALPIPANGCGGGCRGR